jgi:hypothetical protein
MPDPALEKKPILTVADLAERWGISQETVVNRVNDTQAPIPFAAILPLNFPSTPLASGA